MGSTALEAAVPYPRKAAQISRKRQRGTKKINSKKGGMAVGTMFCFWTHTWHFYKLHDSLS